MKSRLRKGDQTSSSQSRFSQGRRENENRIPKITAKIKPRLDGCGLKSFLQAAPVTEANSKPMLNLSGKRRPLGSEFLITGPMLIDTKRPYWLTAGIRMSDLTIYRSARILYIVVEIHLSFFKIKK